ncbi:VASN protein, partial [Amia calva]|nr:VASN protein [Amia calva]
MKLFPLLLLLPVALVHSCPDGCTCLYGENIFCTQRRASSMPRNVPESTQNLYLFQNGITSLRTDDFSTLAGLVLLDLSQNRISELPGQVFEPLASLCNLDLSANQITEISKGTFAGLHMLERLYLHGNRIQNIHTAAFDGLDRLLELKLQENQITVLPALRMPSLLLLDISFNKIPSPRPENLELDNLESLKMSGLGLSYLDENLMKNLGNLHDLDLSKNQLKAVPAALKQCRGLITLNLAGNPQVAQLKKEDFQNLENLQELNLSNLNLQGIPEGLLQLFPRLQTLSVAENPFNCVCPLAWFPLWVRSSQVELARIEETRCHFPPLNAGKVLKRLEHKDFGCPTTTTTTTTTVKTSRPEPPVVTTLPTTTLPTPSPSQSSMDNAGSTPPPDTPELSSKPDPKVRFCPPNICLNGGTCQLDHKGHVEKATSTSILVDLHRYIQARPQLRGIRLTYRNLSGPDRRPMQLSVPASYPEYTLRGLRPNCTYHICASPLGEPETEDSFCTEAQTSSQQLHHSPITQSQHGQLTTMVVPLVAVVLVVVVAVAGGIYYVRRKRAKGHPDLGADPCPLELEGVKACLENGTLPQKVPDVSQSPNGLEYEVPLMQGHGPANNNVAALKPSYF